MKAKVCKRIQKNVESKDYYLRYTLNGKQIWKRLEGITSKEKAIEYYKNEFLPLWQKYETAESAEELEILAKKRILKKQNLESYTFEQIFEFAMNKPRSVELTDKKRKLKKMIWEDFTNYLKNEMKIEKIHDVVKIHAEYYISEIRKNGRYSKNVSYKKGNGKTTEYIGKNTKLSELTLNTYLSTLKEIFNLIKGDIYLMENPFGEIKKLKVGESERRESFTEQEIELILEKIEEDTEDAKICKPLFTIAFQTGLREGDIRDLKWSDVDFGNQKIRRRTNKTKKIVEIPFLGSVEEYLSERFQTKDESGYVFPELQNRHKDNISRVVKRFLENIGIEDASVVVEGRSRKTSKKDLHSCRHTFATLAMRNGVNPEIVKQILGHTDIKMTEHYTHLNLEDARKELQKIENLFGKKEETDIDKIRKALESADEKTVEKIKKMLDIV